MRRACGCMTCFERLMHRSLVCFGVLVLSTPIGAQQVGRAVAESCIEVSSPVGAVVVTDDGSVVVGFPAEPAVRIFSSRGNATMSVGRRGNEAAEFADVSGLGVLGDLIYVLDERRGQIRLVRRDGSDAGTDRRNALRDKFRLHRPIRLFADGAALLEPRQTGRGTSETRSAFLRVERGALSADTIAWIAPAGRRVSVTVNGRTYLVPRFFSDAPLVEFSPNGERGVIVDRTVVDSVRVQRSSFSVTLIGAHGDTAFAQRIPYKPMPLPKSLLDSLTASEAEHLGHAGAESAPEDAARTVRDALQVPYTIPTVSGAIIGDDGTVWLRREDTGAASVRWTVLRPGEKSRTDIALPADARVRWVGGDIAWAAVPSADNKCGLVKYRVSTRNR